MLMYEVTSSAKDGYNAQSFFFSTLDAAEEFAESEANTMGFAIVYVVSPDDSEISRFEAGVDGDIAGMMRDTSCADVDGSGNPVRARMVQGRRFTSRASA